MIANSDHNQALTPAKQSMRSDDGRFPTRRTGIGRPQPLLRPVFVRAPSERNQAPAQSRMHERKPHATESTRLAAAVEAAQTAGGLDAPEPASPQTPERGLPARHQVGVGCAHAKSSSRKRLHSAFPEAALLGEEGVAARSRPALGTVGGGPDRWHGELHLHHPARLRFDRASAGLYPAARTFTRTVSRRCAGVVYDPFCDELWTAVAGTGTL